MKRQLILLVSILLVGSGTSVEAFVLVHRGATKKKYDARSFCWLIPAAPTSQQVVRLASALDQPLYAKASK
jgi:hypothetical protein